MDLDDSFVNSLQIEGYDISCVWHNSQSERIPRGTVGVYLSLFLMFPLWFLPLSTLAIWYCNVTPLLLIIYDVECCKTLFFFFRLDCVLSSFIKCMRIVKISWLLYPHHNQNKGIWHLPFLGYMYLVNILFVPFLFLIILSFEKLTQSNLHYWPVLYYCCHCCTLFLLM